MPFNTLNLHFLAKLKGVVGLLLEDDVLFGQL
jgi:hypothetical protein